MELSYYGEKVDKMIKEKFAINSFYSGTEMLKQKDINGNEALCYISTNNRTSGKTSYLCLLNYIYSRETGRKFCYFVRNSGELGNYGEVFSDIISIYDLEGIIVTKPMVKDTIYQIMINGKTIALVLAMKKYVSIKKYSPIFSEVDVIALEEYQPEDGRYLKNEVDIFRSLYRSVARGGGERARNVYIYMNGNPVTLMNPYLLEFDISHKYSYGNVYIKSPRCVAEFRINEEAAADIKNSGATELFSNGLSYDMGKDFLINDKTYLSKCHGKADYLFTLIYGNKRYGIRRFKLNGEIHISKKSDPSFKKILAFKENDREQNVDLLERYDFSWNYLRTAYKLGLLRFGDLEAKSVIYKLLGIDLYC